MFKVKDEDKPKDATPSSFWNSHITNIDVSQLVLGVPPLSTSGDIYHIFVFILLAKKFNEPVPTIFLATDSSSTDVHLERSANFLKKIKVDFQEIRIESKCYQASPRLAEMRKLIYSQGYTHYMDQKTCTSFISKFVEKNKSIAMKIIKEEIKKAMNILEEKEIKEIKNYVEETITKVKEYIDNNYVIILLRNSNNINQNQNMINTGSLVDHLRKKFKVIVIHVHDNKKMTNTSNTYNIYPFHIRSEFQLEKFFHIGLLLELFEKAGEMKLNGIVGNTSGTLDIAAFMGHDVYNIHNFGSIVSYQDYRLLTQNTFMQIEKSENWKVLNKESIQLLLNLDAWFESKKQPELTIKVQNTDSTQYNLIGSFLLKDEIIVLFKFDFKNFLNK